MKVSWMGHSCFLLETAKGLNIITDPYESGSYSGEMGYGPLNIQPDIVTVSHKHIDHSYTREFNKARIFDREGFFTAGNVEIQGIASYHDKERGRRRGNVIIFLIKTEGLTLAHFGDLGTLDIDYGVLKDIDIAFIPVGGHFTIDAEEATALIRRVNPRISIPMHFKTPKLQFDISSEEPFIKANQDVERAGVLDVTPATIGNFKKIVVLDYQR